MDYLKSTRNYPTRFTQFDFYRAGRKGFLLSCQMTENYYEQITDEEITTPSKEDYDAPQLDEGHEETFKDERLDSIALYKQKRSTARYV